MEIVRGIARMRDLARADRRAGRRIGFVPTMGALHDGHLSLVRAARDGSDTVVMSVFVNPMQFGPSEDLGKYPRNLERDAELAAREGVDLLFAPPVEEMYGPGFSTTVEVATLSDVMCGASRPGHFRGVTTVVMKLFQIVSPHVAVFGAKDFQQAVIVRRMAVDLDLDVEIVVAPIVREKDGLAMSSRNAYLSAGERRAARALRRSLDEAETRFAAGERSAGRIDSAVRSVLDAEPLARTDYVAIVDPATLRPADPDGELARETLVALAVWIGGTRLIDNTVLRQ